MCGTEGVFRGNDDVWVSNGTIVAALQVRNSHGRLGQGPLDLVGLLLKRGEDERFVRAPVLQVNLLQCGEINGDGGPILRMRGWGVRKLIK